MSTEINLLLANMPIQYKIVFLKVQLLCDVMLCVVQVVPFVAMEHSAFTFNKQSKIIPLALKMKTPWSFEMSAASRTTTQHHIPENVNQCAVHICTFVMASKAVSSGMAC